jgi:hypothetical protein
MIDCTMKRLRTGSPSVISFEIPKEWRPVYKQMLEIVEPKVNGFYRVQINPPFVPRTTHKHGQEPRFRGHCKDLADQIVDEKTGLPAYTPKEIADAMLRMAAGEELIPTKMGPDGQEVPVHTDSLSKGEMDKLLKLQQRFADEHGYWLTEYVAEGSEETYKSIGGRSFDEMKIFWEERGGD